MHLNAGTKMYEKVALHNVVHYNGDPSKLLVIFSKTAIFKNNISERFVNNLLLIY